MDIAHRLLSLLLLLVVIALCLTILLDGVKVVCRPYQQYIYITLSRYQLWIGTVRIPTFQVMEQYRVRYYRLVKVR